MSTLFTKEQIEKLTSNGSNENRGKDHAPVVMLTAPYENYVWLITEMLPNNGNIGFGLCNIDKRFPELGYIDLREISELYGYTGLDIFNNTLFESKFPISAYYRAANAHGKIVWNEEIIKRYIFTADISD